LREAAYEPQNSHYSHLNHRNAGDYLTLKEDFDMTAYQKVLAKHEKIFSQHTEVFTKENPAVVFKKIVELLSDDFSDIV